MSSPLSRLKIGRRSEQDGARAAMLSRLGIAEEKPRDIFRDPEPVVEALASTPTASPAPPVWVGEPANDLHTIGFDVDFSAPPRPSAPAPEPEPAAEVAEDPFEAIRRQYRKPPSTLPPIPVPNVHINVAPVGVRRRKAGELNRVRKVIWGLSWLAAGTIGWALLTGDESSPIVQAFGMLLP
jgi:hypothetical protein